MDVRFAMPAPDMRLFYFLLALTTIGLGLASRHFAVLLPSWLAKNAGDVLYATMVYWLTRLAFPASIKYCAALAAFAGCVLIEILKLCHAPWAEALRTAPGGRLVFGYIYQTSNIICYFIGVLLGCGIDLVSLRLHPTQGKQ